MDRDTSRQVRSRALAPTAVALAILLVAPVAAALGHGVDTGRMDEAKAAGARVAYGQFWVGDWSNGNWAYLEQQLAKAKAAGVTPVVEWYYWGDAISPNCVRYGCQGLSKGEWNAYGDAISKKVRAVMGDRPAVIVLESEFNKNGVQDWEEFDGLLASHMDMLKRNAPNAKLALGFGNWAPDKWARFDRAMAKADYAGIQLMRGMTRDSWASYTGAPDALLNAAKKLQATFRKPVIVHDVALASHNALDAQANVVKGLAARQGSLEAAGVVGLVFRNVRDYAEACTCWYYGAAERTFGLKYAGGSAKPAWHAWVAMAKGGTTTTVAPTGFSATFKPANGNEWWVQVGVSATKPLAGVDASVNGGAWTPLSKTSYGWAKSIHVPDGATVKFRAKSTDGAFAYSAAYPWPR